MSGTLRVILDLAALLALLLALLVGVAWIRSYRGYDGIVRYSPQGTHSIVASEGIVAIAVTSYTTPSTITRADHAPRSIDLLPSIETLGQPVLAFRTVGWRSGQDAGGDDVCIVWAPHWLIFVSLLAPAAARLRFSIRRRRRLHAAAAGLCSRCGYDLRATPDLCPECGLATAIAL